MAEKCYFHSDVDGYITEPVMIGGTRIYNPKLVEITNYGFMNSHTDIVIQGELCSGNMGNNHGNVFEPQFTWTITRLIFSGPMTIVFWNDGTKTTVRLHEEKGKRKAAYDKYTAITWAMAKKHYGSRSQLEKRLRDICDDSKYDNMLVFTMLATLFGDTKKLDTYVEHALMGAEDYNEK